MLVIQRRYITARVSGTPHLTTTFSLEYSMTKSVLVTGAGSGFGKGACHELARRGHNVIAAVETSEQVGGFEEASNIRVEKIDITTDDVEMLEEIEIDVLINNAGVGRSGPLADIPMDQVERVLEVNVLGTLRITQKALAQMIPRKSGTIIVMSSVGGLVTVPGFGAYTMSKHALEAMGNTLKSELDATGVKVALINPGPYATGFNDRMADSMWQWFDKRALQNAEKNMFREVGAGITGNQLDPAEVVELMADLAEMDDPPLQSLVPSNILEAFG